MAQPSTTPVGERPTTGVEQSQLGISRRTLLRRGAAVGVGVAWAAPAVTRFATPALALDSPQPAGHAISWIAVVVRTDAGWYRAKWEADENAWEGDPGPPNPTDCYPPEYFTPGISKIDGGAEGITLSVDPADPSRATVAVPATVNGEAVQQASAAAFGGLSCDTKPLQGCAGGCSFSFDL